MDEKALQEALFGMTEPLATMREISCELSCNCSGRDELSTTLKMFDMMSSYSWDTKVVLALAAFALIYGELKLVTVISDHPMAKPIMLLKQLPQKSELILSPPNTLTSLIEAIVNTTSKVVCFNRESREYFSTRSHAAVYWIVRSVVVCVFYIIRLVGWGYKSTPQIDDTMATEFSRLKEKVSESQSLLEMWNSERIEATRQHEIFMTLEHFFHIKTTVINSTEIFKILFNANDEQQPLLEFPDQQRCEMDVLRGKNVILAISESVDLDGEVNYLYDMCQKSEEQRQAIQYEVVWLRLLDKAKVKEEDTRQRQIKLRWYVVHYDHIPSISDGVTTYIKKNWQFNKKSTLVMLDAQGKIVSPNAIHMLRIFGRFDFSTREEHIWKKEDWGLKFWFDGIDNGRIYVWIKKKRYSCLCEIINDAQKVMDDANFKIDMMYVGRKNLKKTDKTKIADGAKKLGITYFLDTNSFWSRLESMWYCMTQNKNFFEEDNHQMLDLKTMLSFTESKKGWALINEGSTTIAKASGDKIINCFQHYASWKQSIHQNGFMKALSDYLEELKKDMKSHCNHLTMSKANGWIPETLKCTDCGKLMEKSVTFRCCDD